MNASTTARRTVSAVSGPAPWIASSPARSASSIGSSRGFRRRPWIPASPSPTASAAAPTTPRCILPTPPPPPTSPTPSRPPPSRSRTRARSSRPRPRTPRYGKLPEYDAYDLGVWALKSALEDCGLGFGDVDGLIINRIADSQRFGEITGINPRYTTITPGQGRFSGICIQTAVAVIAAGLAEVVALVYGNNGRSAGDHYGGASDAYGSGRARPWVPYRLTSPRPFPAVLLPRPHDG